MECVILYSNRFSEYRRSYLAIFSELHSHYLANAPIYSTCWQMLCCRKVYSGSLILPRIVISSPKLHERFGVVQPTLMWGYCPLCVSCLSTRSKDFADILFSEDHLCHVVIGAGTRLVPAYRSKIQYWLVSAEPKMGSACLALAILSLLFYILFQML